MLFPRYRNAFCQLTLGSCVWQELQVITFPGARNCWFYWSYTVLWASTRIQSNKAKYSRQEGTKVILRISSENKKQAFFFLYNHYTHVIVKWIWDKHQPLLYFDEIYFLLKVMLSTLQCLWEKTWNKIKVILNQWTRVTEIVILEKAEN